MFADIGEIYEKKGGKKKLKIDGSEYELKKDIEVEKLKRSQPVRFSNGYSISEFVYDMNLLNDIDAYNRYIQNIAGQKKQSLVYPEEHFSYYTYTLTIDLDKVGAVESTEDGRVIFNPVVDPDSRAKRVYDILEIVLLYLNRKIKGRDENLTPVFVIGGMYDVKHPFFANAIYFWEEDQKLKFNADDVIKVLNMYTHYQNINNETLIFYDNSFVEAVGNLPLTKVPINSLLDELKKKAHAYYHQIFFDYSADLLEKERERE
jgi:CRISPR-associated protein Cst2